MAHEIKISARAEFETIAATEYYDAINLELGDRFLAELNDVYKRIANNPGFYSYISDDPNDHFRDVKMKTFPYVVIFEVFDPIVIITAVLNTHRDH